MTLSIPKPETFIGNISIKICSLSEWTAGWLDATEPEYQDKNEQLFDRLAI